MTTYVRDIYKGGRRNDEFLKAIKDADGDKKPGFFASDLEKHLFAGVYYGWLVNKYGNDWAQNL